MRCPVADLYTVTLILTPLATLRPDGGRDLGDAWDECVLCGSGPLLSWLTADGLVVEGDPAVCPHCGAVDEWGVDEGVACPMGRPDEGAEVTVARKMWEDGGRSEWVKRALGVDADVTYTVRDGSTEAPLIGSAAMETDDAR